MAPTPRQTLLPKVEGIRMSRTMQHWMSGFALATVLLGWSAQAAGQGRYLNIMSGAVERVTYVGDMETWQEFPPFAFGDGWGSGPNLQIWLELIRTDCNTPTSAGPCGDGTFVTGYTSQLDTGNCPCDGILAEEIVVQIRYDEAVVQALGFLETDLVMRVYDGDTDSWRAMPGGSQVDPDRNIVVGRQAWNAAMIYAVIAEPGAGDGGSWGRIKSRWR